MADAQADDTPLVVDVDGTLLRTDLLLESGLGLVRHSLLDVARIPIWLSHGRANLKHELGRRAPPDLATLPYNEAVLERLRSEHARGRPLYLASAADRDLVAAIAEQLGLFKDVFGSGQGVNLKGDAKARALVDAFGSGGFDYFGNDTADLAVWRHARRSGLVDAPADVERTLAREGRDFEVVDPRRHDLGAYVRALRPHQWLKNLLVFVPILASQEITVTAVTAATLALIAFSLIASGVYVLNDLVDLPSDRAHHRKSARPFACGAIPILHGAVLCPVLLLAGGTLALVVGRSFLAVVLVYLVLTTAYSLYFKRKALLDVITLAGLYTLRVFGGAAAVGLVVSEWLLAFSMFLFLSLAIIKRHTELVDTVETTQSDLHGRGYRADDLPVLSGFGAAAGYSAVLVLALYTQTHQVQKLYEHPLLLWGVCMLLLYWISRMLLISSRRQMDDDPLVFAVTDRVSLVVFALVSILVLVAA